MNRWALLYFPEGKEFLADTNNNWWQETVEILKGE